MKKKLLATFLSLATLLSLGATTLTPITIPVYAQEIIKSEEDLTPYQVKEDMDSIVEYVENNDIYPAEWMAWFRARTNPDIRLHEGVQRNIGSYYDTVSNNKAWDDVGGITRATITIRSMKEMPTQFRKPGTIDDGVDITEYLLNIPKVKYEDRPNMTSWMLLAMNNLFDFNFNREPLKKLREDLITDLVDGIADNGGWGLSSNSEHGGVDVTGFVLASLAPYKDRPEVQAAIDKSVDFMKQVRGNDVIMECNNSMSYAMMIWGLSEVGEDVMDESWDYNDLNPMEELYKFKVGDEFKWKLDGDVDSWATMQVHFALLSYVASRSDRSLLDFNDQWMYADLPDEEKPLPPVEPELPDPPVEPEVPCEHKDDDKNNICDLCDEKLDDTENPIPPIDPEKPDPPVDPEKPETGNTTNNNTTNNTTNTTNNSTSNTTNNTTHNVTNNATNSTETNKTENPKLLSNQKETESINTDVPTSNQQLLASPSVIIDPRLV